jgi:hypothetical protein
MAYVAKSTPPSKVCRITTSTTHNATRFRPARQRFGNNTKKKITSRTPRRLRIPNSDSEDNATQFDFDLEYPDAEPAADTGMDVGQCLETGSFTNVHARGVAARREPHCKRLRRNETFEDFRRRQRSPFPLPGHIELGM